MIKRFLLLSLKTFCGLSLLAQDTTEQAPYAPLNGRWYASPWIWVIGAGLFILALVALSKEKKQL